MCYLLTSPWSASTTGMDMPEFPSYCCIQETNVICGHDDQNGRGWPSTHHRRSHETNAAGSILGPVCQHPTAAAMISSQSWASVQMYWAISSCYQTSLGRAAQTERRPIRLISSTLILDAEGNFFRLMIRRRAWHPFDVIVFKRCPFSSQSNMINTARQIEAAFWVIGEIGSPYREGLLVQRDGQPWKFVRGSRKLFWILSGVLHWYWHRVPPAVGAKRWHYPDSKVHGANMGPYGSCRPQMGPMLAPWTFLSGSRVIPYKWRQVYYHDHFYVWIKFCRYFLALFHFFIYRIERKCNHFSCSLLIVG